MRNRIYISLLSLLLLLSVSYVQVLQRLQDNRTTLVESMTGTNDCAEETPDKSSEENTREADQDEDSFKLSEVIHLNGQHFISCLSNENHSFSLFGYFPEIVSPPPQV